jgi:hypothetical protein
MNHFCIGLSLTWLKILLLQSTLLLSRTARRRPAHVSDFRWALSIQLRLLFDPLTFSAYFV